MIRIPLQDLARHAEAHGSEWAEACATVIRSGWFVLGPQVAAFEREFAAFLGVNHAVGVANGTDALELALRAAGIGSGDDVLLAANAGMYGTVATFAAEARPVYADIEPRRLSLTVESLAAARTPRSRAVVLTHLYGWAADAPSIAAWCEQEGLILIEDCAEAHGAKIGGKHVGSWGSVGCFSFYPTKNLGALGDGGACVTSNPALDGRLRRLRQYGWARRYEAVDAGGRNSRLDEMQAAILRCKLKHLPTWNERRREIARRYVHGLGPLGLQVPDPQGEDYVGHLFVLRSPRRDSLRERLRQRGIAADVHFPTPDYSQPAVVARLGPGSRLVVTEEACGSVLTLPCFPELRDDEVDRVLDAIRDALRD